MDPSPLFISLKTSLAATAVAFVFGIAAARGVVRLRGRTKAVLDGFFTLPMVLPPTVLGFLLLLAFGRNSPVGQALRLIGVRVVFSWSGTVIAAAIVAFPLVYRTARAGFEQIDGSILAAARTLGMRERAIFWKIMMPMALPGTAGGLVLAFARALGEFGATLMLAGNIPGKTQTIPVAIYFAVDGDNYGLAFFWVSVITVVSFAMMFLLNAIGEKGYVADGRY
jgi:molybdate transport system permease protein